VPTDLEFTGERFLPEVSGQIAFEHLHRYYFAKSLVKGCRVLDVACGEGYGSWILSSEALEVVGVDIAPDAVTHARERYTDSNVSFVEASAAKLPFDDGVFDAVVSFETIEHVTFHKEMMSEIKRVLNKDGIFIISSPNKQYYSIESGYHNPFHVKELFKEEFTELVESYFSNVMLFGQRVVHGSLMVMDNEQVETGFASMVSSGSELHSTGGLAKPLYDLLVASDVALPVVSNTLFEAVVHGMDPAQFYGVHLPDRVARADEKIIELLKNTQVEAMRYAQSQLELKQAQAQARTSDDAKTILVKEVASLQQQVELARNALAAMYQSSSWRLTAPVRWVKSTWVRFIHG
jgi:ubiquinone/menaquinone biosynthesis C-methylase UbiE